MIIELSQEEVTLLVKALSYRALLRVEFKAAHSLILKLKSEAAKLD